jgi:hypothetical protein
MTDDDDLNRRAEATARYLNESLLTFRRAVDLDLLTLEAAVNVCLATASLIATAAYGESGAAALLERQVLSLVAEMRGRQSPAH